VEADKAPVTVSSTVEVTNLNSDMLDNLDSRAFVRPTYTKILSTTSDPTSDNQQFEFIFCDGDDFALSETGRV